MKITRRRLNALINEAIHTGMTGAPTFPILPMSIPEYTRKSINDAIYSTDPSAHEFAIRQLYDIGYPEHAEQLKAAIDYRTREYPNYGTSKFNPNTPLSRR